MVKKRVRNSEVEKFGNAADLTPEEMNEDAPRGKKRGGKDVLLPLNTYEDKMISSAAKSSKRSVSAFIRIAAVEKACSEMDSDT